MFYDNNLDALKGRTIEKIFMDSDYLQFVTDNGTFSYTVDGELAKSKSIEC